jgi:hypothetical protein
LRVPRGFGKNYFSLSAMIAYSTYSSISASDTRFKTLEELQQQILQQQQLNLTKYIAINIKGAIIC